MARRYRYAVGSRSSILDGIYGPGYRLVIDRLAEEFGVSALPVREAVRRLEALDAATEAMVACMESMDVLGFSRANQSFHRVIHQACGNPPLLDLLRNTERRLDAIRRTVVFTHIPYRGLSSIQDHREIVRLIRSKAPDAEVEAAARDHKLRTVQAFREWLDEPPGEESLVGARADARGG